MMTCIELMQLKAQLLCFGIKVSKKTKIEMEQVNEYVFDKGFVHAAHFLIDDTVINTCIAEKFCQKSPFEILSYDKGFKLYKNNNYLTDIRVLPLPNWCTEYVDGYRIGDYIRPHSNNCVSCWPYLKCSYYSKNNQCKFCSIGSYHIKTIISEPEVVRMISKALSFNQEYEIALSGGTCNEPDHSINYFSNICAGAKANGAKYISVETAPPSELSYIKKLHDSGATAIIMNLEIADDRLRKEICPGKASISEAHYMNAYEESVKIFGPGNVSCVLIAGIQPANDIIRKSEELIDLGVIPTIIPFKPLDGCQLHWHNTVDPNELIGISQEIDILLKKNNLFAIEQKGCTKCNGCSLETVASSL